MSEEYIPTIPAQRVKVLKAEYDKATDTIAWQIKLKDGREADVVWLRQDYNQVWGINGLMPVSIVKESCEKIKGKEINLVVEPKPRV